MHIPWDKVDDWDALGAHAADRGVRIGTINSNVFQDDDYRLGSLCNPDARVRRKAIDHHLECIEIMHATGVAGPEDLARGRHQLPRPGRPARPPGPARRRRSARSTPASATDQRLVLEYKFFEPAFYHMDVPDWGTSLSHCLALGERASVCLDTGHHAPGTNIEFIVAQLLRLGKLGSFDFNSPLLRRRRPDRRLGGPVPVVPDPVRGGHGAAASTRRPDVAFMLDQCHNVEPKIPGQIRSVLNVQEMTARALLVDRDALAAAQQAGDVLGANAVMDAFYTDVRADLAAWRESRDLPADPMKAYAASGYAQQIEAERVGGAQAGWGREAVVGRACRELCVRVDPLRHLPGLLCHARR